MSWHIITDGLSHIAAVAAIVWACNITFQIDAAEYLQS